VTRLSQIDQEPRIGRYISELAADRQYLDFFPLDDPADVDRVPFFYPARPQPGVGPFGGLMIDPAQRRYRHGALTAFEFADAHVIGGDGVVILDSGVVKNSLDQVSAWQPDSNIESAREREHLRLRRPMPVSRVVADGRYVIGFNGAWRNHGHWLPQCLPKLYAFTLLRRRFAGLKLVLPPLPPGSAQARTLDLLGIGPEAVYTLPMNEVTCFASAILPPSFDIWTVPNFVSTAAEAVIARLPKPDADAAPRPDKVYVHRAVPARAVANFEALRPVLARYGFTVVSFETMDFAEQVATMLAARHVISEHGAGTANILFCREGARVLELFNPFCVQPAFWSIASRRGLDYGYLIGEHHPTEARPRADWNSDYTIDPAALEDSIRAALRLPPRPVASPASAPAPAPAGAAVSAAAPTPPFSGIAEPIFEVVSNPARLGRGGGHERLPVFAPAIPPPAAPMYRESETPADFVAEHYHYARPLTVAAYAVAGAAVWSTGLVTLGTQFVAPADCMPSYFNEHLRPGAPPMHPIYAGALGRADARVISLDQPVAVATHPNLAYGHGVMEVLPRLWLLAVLREYGADLKLAMSRTVPEWVKLFARMLHAEENFLWYDGANETIQAPAVVLPGMLHTEYNFHPATNLMVRDLVQRLPPGDAPGPALVYLAQANFGEEKLENGAEAEEAMRGLGFTVVRPGHMTPAQHIRLFAGARMVVGEYGFAMCGTLFSPPGTRVVAVNFAAHYLSAIARLRGHRIAYVPPADGRFHHWRLTRELSRSWKVDVATMRGVVQAMMEGLT
jgi:capsular polysaccharide biosynthesis protein